MNIALGIVYVATGLFATLSGFKILHPFKNSPDKRENILKYQAFYRYGGLLVIAYGIYKFFQQT